MHLILLLLFSFLASCSSNSLDDFREEAEGINKSLISDLKEIHTRSELLKAKPAIKKKFNDLVDVIIAAHDYQKKHHEQNPSKANQIVSDQLRTELIRIYSTIDEGREIIENCQEEALNRLDAHLKRTNKNSVY